MVRLRIGLLLLLLRAILDLLVARRKRLRIAWQVRLLLGLARGVARFVLPHISLALVFIAIEGVVAALRLAGWSALLVRLLIVVRVLLTKLLLRRSDQPEIVFGMLVIILGGHRISGPLRITCQLDIFFGNV